MSETTWAPEPSAPRDKYDLAAQLDDSGRLSEATIGRAHLLHRRLEDVWLDRVVVTTMQTGDAIIAHGRFLESRFDAAELVATRFEDCFFRNTRFVAASFRGVVFDRCVFEKCAFELAETPVPESLRFERCLFVESPEAIEKPWRQAGVVTASCTFIGAAAPTPTPARVARPALLPTVAAPAPRPEAPPVIAPAPVPAQAPVAASGRFSALER